MATLKFGANAGILVSGQVKSAIKSYCFQRDISCEVDEDKGFLESTFYFKLSGTDEQIEQAQLDLNKWLSELKGGENG